MNNPRRVAEYSASSRLAEAEFETLAGDPTLALRLLTEVPATSAQAGWLRGVALAAQARYADALAVLAGVSDGTSPAELRASDGGACWPAWAYATSASVLRQLGSHDRAQRADETAIRIAGGHRVAAFQGALGLSADAVGAGDPEAATAALAYAERLFDDSQIAREPLTRSDWVTRHWPREAVRLQWVRCEVALLAGELERARLAAHGAEAASRGLSLRHHAKSLLFVAVTDGDARAAAAAWREAEACRSLSVVWPACLLVSRNSSAPVVVAAARSRGNQVYRLAGRGLPPPLARRWWDAPAARELGVVDPGGRTRLVSRRAPAPWMSPSTNPRAYSHVT